MNHLGARAVNQVAEHKISRASQLAELLAIRVETRVFSGQNAPPSSCATCHNSCVALPEHAQAVVNSSPPVWLEWWFLKIFTIKSRKPKRLLLTNETKGYLQITI